jgi:hypothetical protein
MHQRASLQRINSQWKAVGEQEVDVGEMATAPDEGNPTRTKPLCLITRTASTSLGSAALYGTRRHTGGMILGWQELNDGVQVTEMLVRSPL